jgi:hypothetical protein
MIAGDAATLPRAPFALEGSRQQRDRVRDGQLLRLMRYASGAVLRFPTSAPGEPESAKARPRWWRARPWGLPIVFAALEK